MKLHTKIFLSFSLLVAITILFNHVVVHTYIVHVLPTFLQTKNISEIANQTETRIVSIVDNIKLYFLPSLSHFLFLLGTIEFIIAFFLAYHVSKFTTRKLKRLEHSMSLYQKTGKLETLKIDQKRKDEIDVLSEVYNNLILKIDNQEKIRKEFFIDMSHEIRTPLAQIKGFIQGMIDKVFSSPEETLSKTLQSTNSLIALVDEMTELAKLESANTEIFKQDTDIPLLLHDVEEGFKQSLDEKNMTINVLGDLKASIDKEKFRRVCINLIDNAISYGEKDSAISIVLGNENHMNFLDISNLTYSLSEKTLGFMFERFYRQEESRSFQKKSHRHLGIGLNIVKKIIELHHGNITASYNDNRITFRITFP